MKRVVIKNLKEPDKPSIVVVSGLSEKDAVATQKRFTKLKWDLRRPSVYTIDHIALCIEEDK